jgi:uroporphyrinogen decarboxylase
MTDRERFLAIMRFEPVDRIPYHELGLWGQTRELYAAAGMPEEAMGDWFYGCDLLGLDRRDFAPTRCDLIPPFEHEVIEETDRYEVFRDSQGVLHKALKEGTVRGTRASMDQYVAFPVRTPADFEAVRARMDPHSPERVPADWRERVARWRARDCPLCFQTNACFGLYSHMRRWMGTENLSVAFYDQPALVHAMVDFLVEFFIELSEPLLAQVQCDYFNFFEDFAYKTGPLISPRTFREFLLPAYRRIIGHLRRHGVEFIWLDSDGNTEVLIPLFIEAGITCHWPLEQAANMDPVRLRREYGRDLALVGGIDKRALARGRSEIDRELDRHMRPMLQTGGFIPTIDHTVPPDVPYENFIHYIERKRRIAEGG